MTQHINNFVQCQNLMTYETRCWGSTCFIFLHTFEMPPPPSNNWQVKLEIHERTRLGVHRICPLLLSGFVQIYVSRNFGETQHCQIHRLLTCGQADGYGEANRPFIATFPCESVTNINS